MTKPRRSFVDARFGQVHIRDSAASGNETAPPLLCLHMSPKSGRSFVPVMDRLSANRRVIAPDYPGYGESDLPPENPPVRIEDYAAVMWDTVDALSLEHVDLLGHHTGSKVAVEMASQRPDAVERICLISAACFSKAELEEFKSMFQPIPLDNEGTRFRVMWEKIVKYRGPSMTLEMMSEAMAENQRGGEAYEWGHIAAFEYADRFLERLALLHQKIGVLNPGDELFEATKRSEQIIRNGKWKDCPDWAHGFLNAFPDEASDGIFDLLSF